MMVRIIKMKARMIRAFTFANETRGRVSSVFIPPDAAAAGGSVTTHGLGCQGWDLQAMSSMASPMRSQTARWSSTTKARAMEFARHKAEVQGCDRQGAHWTGRSDSPHRPEGGVGLLPCRVVRSEPCPGRKRSGTSYLCVVTS